MTDRRSNPFLDRVRAGQPTFLLGVRGSRTADVARVAAASGHHGVLVDLEHSPMSVDVAAAICAAAGDLGLTPFARVPEREYGMIGRLLDGGASGIVAPRIESADEARTVARACRFPPRGQRSAIGAVPQLGLRPTPARELNPALDAATVVQILIETPLGVANADAIAAVDGVDMLAIGANDLSAELGEPGRYDSPALHDAVAKVARACARHDLPLMIGGVADLALLEPLLALGASPVFLTGVDTDLLLSAATARVATLSGWISPRSLVSEGV